MEKEYKERKKIREITLFVSKEAKEYACVCGWTGMRPKKIYFTDEVSTKVDLACEQCDEERTVTLNYPDEIIYFDY